MSIQELKTERDRLWDRVRTLKTRKAKDKAIEQAKIADRALFDALYEARDKYADFQIKAEVVDFTCRDDEFLVRTVDGDLLWLSPAADVVSKSWYASTCCVEYTKGQTVVVDCKVEVDFDRGCLNLMPGKIHGGRVNEEQYSALCKRTDLAFFKYPQGMSGLIG